MLHVLTVEDDILTSMYLESVINDISTSSIVIKSSVADAKKALTNSFDVAFLDIDVTNGKTFDVAHVLLEKRIPFIFISGSLREEIPAELRSVPSSVSRFNGTMLPWRSRHCSLIERYVGLRRHV